MLKDTHTIEFLGSKMYREKVITYGSINGHSYSFPFIGNQYFPHLKDNLVDYQYFFDDYFSKLNQYEDFLIKRAKRSYLDVYAAYQPFNEAFKSLYPFLKLAQAKLPPDVPILNLWDRSGWTTSLLLGLFPNNPIYTVWEGNKDVLGYCGYAYWFGQEDRLKVFFIEIDQPLPFTEDFFGLVIGLDAFHRYDQNLLMQQLAAMTTQESAIFFPHVHLANSEPTPYFDRGGIQRHGLEYQQWFDLSEWISRKWKGYILSEPEIFKFNDCSDETDQLPLYSNPDTTDYNSIIVLLSKHWQVQGLTVLRFSAHDISNDLEDFQLVVNPLYHIDLSKGNAHLDMARSEVKKLLDRHPVYLERVVKNIELTDNQLFIVFHAMRGLSIAKMVQLFSTPSEMVAEILKLEKFGLVHCVRISQKHLALQLFISKQTLINEIITLHELWNKSVIDFGQLPYIRTSDGSVFSYDDIDELVKRTQLRLRQNCNPNDRIAIISKPHIESIVLFWAAVMNGLVVVPVNGLWKTDVIQFVLNQTEPTLIFLDTNQKTDIQEYQTQTVLLDDSDEQNYDANARYFSTWLDEPVDKFQLQSKDISIFSDQLAVVMYTSGSTGAPKGVQLTHHQLVQSGINMSSHFGWTDSDAYFCTGGLEFMSGLRNMTTAPARCGASIYIPNSSVSDVFALADEIEKSTATILASNPHLINSLCRIPDRNISFDKLRLVLCTGNVLTNDLKQKFMDRYQKAIYNYYGHTETAGICLAESILPMDPLVSSSIGRPVNAIVQLVDDTNQIVTNGIGQMRIYSTCVSSGYYKLEKHVAQSDGWYYTGDLARYTENGSFEFVSRQKEIFKSPREQIHYLSDIQDHLLKIDWIEQAIAVSHYEENTEWLYIFVSISSSTESTETVAAIKDYFRKNITHEVLPLKIVFRNSFEYISGKINRQILIDEIKR